MVNLGVINVTDELSADRTFGARAEQLFLGTPIEKPPTITSTAPNDFI